MTEIVSSAWRALGLALSSRSPEVLWEALSPPEWKDLVETAQQQRVAPLLYHELESCGWPESTPSHLVRQLKSAYYGASGLNLMLYEELARVLHALESRAGVARVVLLKGVALASTLYPDLALRPMSDLDLLIPREQIPAATDALRGLGYSEFSPEMAPGLAEVVHYHAALHGGPHGSIGVELHWGLIAGETDWRSPSIEWFWKETEPWAWEGPTAGRLEALQLKPTAHLLYLTAHLLLQHGAAQAQLVWYYDVHLMASRWASRIDWEELASRARALRWAAALAGALQASQELFATPLPDGFLDSLAPEDDPAASRLVQSKSASLGRGARVWGELSSLGWRGRWRLVRSILLPSPSYVRWRYAPRPGWLWPLCYPYRWGVVALEAVVALGPFTRNLCKYLAARAREVGWATRPSGKRAPRSPTD